MKFLSFPYQICQYIHTLKNSKPNWSSTISRTQTKAQKLTKKRPETSVADLFEDYIIIATDDRESFSWEQGLVPPHILESLFFGFTFCTSFGTVSRTTLTFTFFFNFPLDFFLITRFDFFLFLLNQTNHFSI